MTTTFATNQLGSGQDFVTHGSIENEFDYLIVADGHGKGNIIKLLSSPTFDWDTIVKNNTAKTILTAINKTILLNCLDTYKDGSTLSIVKIFPTEIKVYWMGDSQVHIKINDKYYKTKNHNTSSYTKEINEGTISVTSPSWCQHILSDTEVTIIETRYFILNNGESLAMLHALGHEFCTTQRLDELTVQLALDDEVDILVATDGLWDVVYEPDLLCKFPKYTAEDFMQLATARWNQEWNYTLPSVFKDSNGNAYPPEKTTLESKDDIGVVVYKNNRRSLKMLEGWVK